jgi:hypothetical protein
MSSTVRTYVNQELDRLRSEWPAVTTDVPKIPGFTWDEFLEGLLELSNSEVDEMILRGATTHLVRSRAIQEGHSIVSAIISLVSSATAMLNRATPTSEFI